MELLVDRVWKKDTYTISRFFINLIRFHEALEDKDRGLKQTDSLASIKARKVYGKTAIPSGRYEVVLSKSAAFERKTWARKYKGLVPEILNVPGFTGIRIHPLNSAEESLGCIGLGENKIKGAILNSTKTYYEFMDKYIIPATERGEKIYITIK